MLNSSDEAGIMTRQPNKTSKRVNHLQLALSTKLITPYNFP